MTDNNEYDYNDEYSIEALFGKMLAELSVEELIRITKKQDSVIHERDAIRHGIFYFRYDSD